MVKTAFSIYLGWISVATIANFAALLVDLNWNGFGIPGATWTVIMLAVATLLSVAMIWFRKDWAYTLVMIWAFIAILVKRQVAGGPESAWLATMIYIFIGLMVVSGLVRFLITPREL